MVAHLRYIPCQIHKSKVTESISDAVAHLHFKMMVNLKLYFNLPRRDSKLFNVVKFPGEQKQNILLFMNYFLFNYIPDQCHKQFVKYKNV